MKSYTLTLTPTNLLPESIDIEAESDDYAMRSAMMWASCKLSQLEADQGHVTVWDGEREVGRMAVRLGVDVPATRPSA